jgi:hypothetical protein
MRIIRVSWPEMRGAQAEIGGGGDVTGTTNIKALCFDTGGTILDWHTGMRTAFSAVGSRNGMERFTGRASPMNSAADPSGSF